MRLTTFTIPLVSLLFGACIGEAPTMGDDDTTPDADPGTPPSGVMVTGKTLDYFSTTIPQGSINGVMVATDSVTPPVSATSDAMALYTMELPPGSTVVSTATYTAFRPTRNEAIETGDMATAPTLTSDIQ